MALTEMPWWETDDPLLRPRQAARLLGVSAKTVSRWAVSGKLEAQRTAGGHHRFRLSDVRRLAGLGYASSVVIPIADAQSFVSRPAASSGDGSPFVGGSNTYVR
jgi:excisionase family DNA binding protein